MKQKLFVRRDKNPTALMMDVEECLKEGCRLISVYIAPGGINGEVHHFAWMTKEIPETNEDYEGTPV